MKSAFKFFALLSFCAALYHTVGLFHHVNDAPRWRHALFIAIDLVCVFGFLRRPRWFVWFFAVLAVQQWSSHGGSLLRKFAEEGHLSWIDLGGVIFMMSALICLIIDARRKSEHAH